MMDTRIRLTSWKDIARHLERDVRTVMRWEKERGLPVYRLPGGRGTRVWAYVDELNAWLADAPPQPAVASATGGTWWRPIGVAASRRWKWRAAAGVAGLALVIAVVWRPVARVEDVVIEQTELRAIDSSHKTVWTFRVPEATTVSASGIWRHIADLDGDGRPEVLVALLVGGPNSSLATGVLYCFNDAGELEWSYSPQDRWRFAGDEYSGPWHSSSLAVVRLAQGVRVAWAVRQHTWWPSMLLLFDDRGRSELAFVHAGWLSHASTVAASSDGRRLFATGISNSRQEYFLAVLDAPGGAAASPEPAGSPFECRGCPSNRPLAYYTFPRTEASRTVPFPADPPTLYMLEDGRAQVWVHETVGSLGPSTIYEFGGPGFADVRARYTDSYWQWHREAERGGVVDHSTDGCPERSILTVSRWLPGAGWTSLRLAAGHTAGP